MASAPLIENYPGFSSISGSELANNMFEQVNALGVDVELDEVKQIVAGDVKKVVTDSNTYEGKSVIIATGSKYRLLGLENEENLIGNGIHFCTACDGFFFKQKYQKSTTSLPSKAARPYLSAVAAVRRSSSFSLCNKGSSSLKNAPLMDISFFNSS